MRTVRFVVECVLADRHELTEDSLEELWSDAFSSLSAVTSRTSFSL